MTRDIYCVGCNTTVSARLTNGKERYPHRPDLYDIPFWRCDGCGNYVGCHWKTSKPTRPLGCIATPELLKARKAIHALLDPLWESGRMPRGKAYARISRELGHEYHTGELRSLEEARDVYRIVARMHNELLR